MIVNKFVAFIGTIVNINGVGENFGKVQIHILGDQGVSNIPEDDMLWAIVMMPNTSAAELGVGITPNWLNVGTTVFGLFLDDVYRNIPIIIGTINQDKDIGHGISKFASGEKIPRSYTATENELNVDNQRRPNYNNNKVITTSSKESPNTINHIIEIDDTPGSERVLVKHKNGSYVEMLPDGTTVVKAKKIGLVADNIKTATTGDVELGIGSKLKLRADSVEIIAESINIAADLNITGTVAVVGLMTLNGRPVLTG